MKNLLTWKFWFSSSYAPLTSWPKASLLVFTGVLIIGAVVTIFLKKKRNLYAKLCRSLHSFFLANAIVGLFVCFFVYEEVPFFSARIWFLVWAAEMIIWLWYLWKEWRSLPGRKQYQKEQEQYRKYLPK